jgi:hypothetical protein
MSHRRFLHFEDLEERQLLSGTQRVPHAKRAIATTMLVLNGTLAVDNKATTTSMDDEGDITTSIPVAGQLGALGEVHGTWNTSADQYGDYLSPDTLQLRDSKGTFVVAFNEQDSDAVHHLAGGAEENVHPQLGSDGTGAYARTKESGTIELTTNSARTLTESMTLTTQIK